MYKKFFGLEEPPFNLTPDPRFLFLSQRHREAIAALMYGISERKGFIALTGEIGAGKTTICRSLMNEVTAETKVALILNPSLSEVELLQSINEEFGIPHRSDSKKELLDELNRFLLRQRALGHTAMLIIDESQNLSPNVLEQIRMISNLETESEKLIQIVLMGQPELAGILALPELEQLNQRITVRYHITPLDEEESIQYIRHRLFVGKAKVELDIDAKAKRMIQEHTGGVPRKINVLMDRVLLTAYVEGTYSVGEDIIRKAIAEVKGNEGFARQSTLLARGRRNHSRRRWIRPAIATAVTLIVGVVGAVTALQWINPFGAQSGIAAAASNPDQSSATPATHTPNQMPLAVNGSAIEPGVAVRDLDLPSAFGAMAEPADDWTYDSHNIVRVSDPGESWHASLLTLMSIWSHQRFDLDAVRDAGTGHRQRVVEGVFNSMTDHGFRRVEMEGSISRLLRCDIPMILTMDSDSPDFSPNVVLIGAESIGGEEVISLLDPARGLIEADRTSLSLAYAGQATVLYPDPLRLDEVTTGETGERVEQIQRTLAATGHYSAAITGTFDETTRQALREFQRDERLEATGSLDGSTALLLALATPADEEVNQ